MDTPYRCFRKNSEDNYPGRKKNNRIDGVVVKRMQKCKNDTEAKNRQQGASDQAHKAYIVVADTGPEFAERQGIDHAHPDSETHNVKTT
jgi:hypothetical protein